MSKNILIPKNMNLLNKNKLSCLKHCFSQHYVTRAPLGRRMIFKRFEQRKTLIVFWGFAKIYVFLIKPL